jgi:hypothetical protein
MEISIEIGNQNHEKYAYVISKMIVFAAQKKGTTIALRNQEYILDKIKKGKAVIALDGEILVGFCYFQNWENDEYIAHSGLIINENYLGKGLSRKIKKQIFDLSRQKFPKGKIFGLTTSKAVIKINYELGYETVKYNQLTKDDKFWEGCKSCINYKLLSISKRENCKCTGMLYDSSKS